MDKQVIRNKLRHSMFVRIIMAPFITVQRKIRKKFFQLSEDASYVRKFKNKHIGERCFIIGNGPSLRANDLESLKKEVCFGTNRIYYIFDRTKWRPDYYVSIDNDVLSKEISEIKKQDIENKFINICAKKYGRGENDNIHYIYVDGKFYIRRINIKQEKFSENPSLCLSETCSATCTCIELAVYMGFKEIYLIGMDHRYAQMVTNDGKKHNDSSIQTYFQGMKNGDRIAIAYIDNVTASYEICNEYAKQHGIKIYNATRGGYLEVFERVNLDDIIRKVDIKENDKI